MIRRELWGPVNNLSQGIYLGRKMLNMWSNCVALPKEFLNVMVF